MVSTEYILKTYGISKEWGFLSSDFVDRLPVEYSAWEKIAEQFTSLLNANILREKLDAMPIIADPIFQSKAEWERAMLLLSYFGHAYILAMFFEIVGK